MRIIREIAEALLTRDWAVAQLTLDQFGFETWEPTYDFDSLGYFVNQVKKEPDDMLVPLHDYLLGDDAAPTASDGPWNGQLPVNVFLSHIHEHRVFAGRLKSLLAHRGIDAFVAHDDIQPSQQWREVIKAALSTCHVFVAILHSGFHQSQWCDQEVGWALGRGVPVLAVRPVGIERRDGFLEEHQDLLLTPDPDEPWVANQILETIVRDPRTNTLGVRALVEALVNSGSFNSTRYFFGLLHSEDAIEPEQLRRLEYAVQTNRQVYEAVFGQPPRPLPELVAELVKRHDPPPTPPPYYDGEPF